MLEKFDDISARLETSKDFVRWGASAFNRAGLHFEHGTANDRGDNFYSVAYWYQTEPHAAFSKLPSVEERLK